MELDRVATQPGASRRPGRWTRIGVVVAGLVSAVGLASMIGMATWMIRSGRGLESYRTAWMVDDSWLGFLASVACTLLAIAVGLVVRIVHERRERREWLQIERGQGG